MLEIHLPEEIPVMTLPQTVLFPQTVLPLHIFEDRYRQMLHDVLRSDRIFAVVAVNNSPQPGTIASEPPHRVGTAGLIRLCQHNDNGTSNLLLQGFIRVEVLRIIRERPYRCIQVRPLESPIAENENRLGKLRDQLLRLIAIKQNFGIEMPEEMQALLEGVDDPSTVADLAAFSLCDDLQLKQTLLETLDPGRRIELFIRRLRRDIADLKLHRKLQGPIKDDDIPLN